MSAVELDPAAAEELHVVGVYRGVGGETDDDPGGAVEVVVHQSPKPIVLVLSGSSAVTWNLRIDPEAAVSAILTRGDLGQQVLGAPVGVPITRIDGENHCMRGWETWRQDSSCDYWSSIREIRDVTGLMETSFQGCFAGGRFEIPHWTGEPPPCRESVVTGDFSRAREEVDFPGCEAVQAEPRYCLTVAEDGPALLGLESGTVCPVTWGTPAFPGFATGIAWLGENMLLCDDFGGGLVRVSLRDGGWEYLQVPCTAIVNAGQGLLLSRSDRGPLSSRGPNAAMFSSYPSLLAGDPTLTIGFDGDMYELFPFALEQMAVHENVLYGAYGAGGQIAAVDLADGSVRTFSIKRHRDWIYGWDALDDGSLVVVGPRGGSVAGFLDPRTGKRRRRLRLERPIYSGLSCVSRSSR